MSTLTALARAKATEQQVAQRVCTVRHVHLSKNPLVLIPLAFAGEANAPLAIMVGDSHKAPRLLTVAEPRDRTQRFELLGELAKTILQYLDTSADDPQILIPNAAGVSFTRLLGRSTRFRRTTGEWAVPEEVPVLGRWLTFLSERTEYPGSCLMVAMTGALALHWATGQSQVEDLNLAALLGWIAPAEGETGAQAAAAAENPVLRPPAGPATDPTFDNEILTHHMRRIRTAKSTGDGRTYERAKTALDAALTTQLAPTWTLMWRATYLLRQLPEGSHVQDHWDTDVAAFVSHADHIREGGPPQARRDSAIAAARRLATFERVQEMVSAHRAFDDPLVMAEYRLAGEAFAGEVIAAEPDRLDASGKRPKLRPHITIATSDDPRRIAVGALLTSPARPKQEAHLIGVSPVAGRWQLTFELSGGMGRKLVADPGTVPVVGERVCYATFSGGFRRPPQFPAPEDTPWTHGGPPAPYVPPDDAAAEVWS
jgi:hypothetical protein